MTMRAFVNWRRWEARPWLQTAAADDAGISTVAT